MSTINLIDWRMVCVLLHRHMTYYMISKTTRTAWKHVHDLAAGHVKEPRFNAGVRLLDLAYDTLSEDEFRRILKR